MHCFVRQHIFVARQKLGAVPAVTASIWFFNVRIAFSTAFCWCMWGSVYCRHVSCEAMKASSTDDVLCSVL